MPGFDISLEANTTMTGSSHHLSFISQGGNGGNGGDGSAGIDRRNLIPTFPRTAASVATHPQKKQVCFVWADISLTNRILSIGLKSAIVVTQSVKCARSQCTTKR